MAHVLIPTDLSDNALNAACYAVNLYGDEGNTFTLLHCYGMPHAKGANLVNISDLLARDAVDGLAAFDQRLRDELPDHAPKIGLATEQGNLTEVIRRYEALVVPPDLIIMGTQGSAGLKRILVGSNTASVILRVRTSVLTIPEEATYRAPGRIMMIDDGRFMDKADLKQLLDIARWSKAEVMIVHIALAGRSLDEPLGTSAHDELFGAIPRTHHSIDENNLVVALNELADQNDVDLMAVPHRHRSQFERYFHRSMSKRLAMYTHIPMLVLQMGSDR